MAHAVQLVMTRSRLYAGLFAITTIVFFGVPATGQYSGSTGATASYATSQSSPQAVDSVEACRAAPASNEVLHLSLRDAIDRALKYNLGSIESGEDTRMCAWPATDRPQPVVAAGQCRSFRNCSARKPGDVRIEAARHSNHHWALTATAPCRPT